MKGKRVLLIVLFSCAAFFFGCSTLDLIPSSTTIKGYDFRKYSDSGFMITPEKIEYLKTVAVINLTHYPEVKKVRKDKNPSSEYKWEAVHFETAELIDSLYQFARDLGADAIMNFKVEPTEYFNTLDPGVIISGLAVKRKE